MNSRLLQFIQAENISQAQFADSIGVARASVSHILAGRNKPGFDFIESMARRYPSLNIEWLVTGRGKMYKSPQESASDAVSRPIIVEAENGPEEIPGMPHDSPDLFSGQARYTGTNEIKTLGKRSQSPIKQRNISKIVVFYDDGSYQELN